MSQPSKLDAILAESADEIRGYLRESFQRIGLIARKGLERLDAGELPIAQAEGLFDEAKSVLRNTDNLMIYEEIDEKVKET